MAIYFSLEVDFGSNLTDAESARQLIRDSSPLLVGARRVGLHRPDGAGPRVAAVPQGVGYGLPVELADRTEPLNLDIDELSAVGRSLYALLRKFAGYRIAAVGWERADTWFDLDELRSDYADELAAGDLPGLVVSNDVYETLPGAKGFETFEPGYQWIPYRGERST